MGCVSKFLGDDVLHTDFWPAPDLQHSNPLTWGISISSQHSQVIPVKLVHGLSL